MLLPAACSLRASSQAFTVTEVARFDEPWALAFLPDRGLLVSEMGGRLKLRVADGTVGEIGGIPAVDRGGQGGFRDIVLHPGFADNELLYFSYMEGGENDTRGAVVARGHLDLSGSGEELRDTEVIWRQVPKVTGEGHFSQRVAFGLESEIAV